MKFNEYDKLQLNDTLIRRNDFAKFIHKKSNMPNDWDE